MSLTILTTVHPRAAAAALSTGKRLTKFSVAYGSLQISFACHPSRGRKILVPLSTFATPQGDARGSTGNPRFPLRGSAAVAAKGCTGWSVAMTLYRHPDCQPAACLPMQSLTILTTVHPCAAAVALSPSRGRKILVPLSTFATPQGDARGSTGNPRFPLRGSAAVAAKGCTGWSVAMTRCCQSRPPNGGLLTDAVINDSYCSTPLRHCVALSPSRGRKGKWRF